MSAHDRWQDVVFGTDRFSVIAGDCRVPLLEMPAGVVGVCLMDPPYDEKTHSSVRRAGDLADVADHDCRKRRKTDLGFVALDPVLQADVARECARLVKRWTGAFCTVEMVHGWVGAFEDRPPLRYVRTVAWVKQGSTPQFTGDRPAVGFECMVLAHPKGRMRWNGGGGRGVYTHPIELPRLGRGPKRIHTTQKPIALMLELVELFTEPGEIVIDPFCGSGTTGLACLRLGRRFIGMELDPAMATTARDRLKAELGDTTLDAVRAGQRALFGNA
jgi:site-specific DNA-methyltransferase (adenine-specific)